MFFVVLAWDKPDSPTCGGRPSPATSITSMPERPACGCCSPGPCFRSRGWNTAPSSWSRQTRPARSSAFMEQDPYVAAGLFASIAVHPWLWSRGNPYLGQVEGKAP